MAGRVAGKVAFTPMAHGFGGLQPLITEKAPALGPIRMSTLPVTMADPLDISNAVRFLASDESRYTTGLQLTVDAGCTIR